jgi:membrane fusion protein (multidrug efflux system)
VVATVVEPESYNVTESFPGTLMANSVVEIRTDVSGYLEAIRVEDGSWVKKGQILYEIDKSRYQASYNQAKAALQQAEAELAQRQRDLERYQSLLSHDAIARQTVDQAATAVKTSEANVAAAKANLQRAATDLNHAVLRAPISGKLGIVQVKVGDLVSAGQTLINTIVNDDPMYADFDVPQSRYGDFMASSSQNASAKQYYLKLADSSLYPEEGKLLVVNNMVDPRTGTIRIRLQFPNERGLLKSGMSCVVLLKHPTDSTALAIPTKAMMQTLGEASVYTVGAGSVIQAKQIEPGAQLDSLLLVERGLQPGDTVVTEGLQKARPGDTVNVQLIK